MMPILNICNRAVGTRFCLSKTFLKCPHAKIIATTANTLQYSTRNFFKKETSKFNYHTGSIGSADVLASQLHASLRSCSVALTPSSKLTPKVPHQPTGSLANTANTITQCLLHGKVSHFVILCLTRANAKNTTFELAIFALAHETALVLATLISKPQWPTVLLCRNCYKIILTSITPPSLLKSPLFSFLTSKQNSLNASILLAPMKKTNLRSPKFLKPAPGLLFIQNLGNASSVRNTKYWLHSRKSLKSTS